MQAALTYRIAGPADALCVGVLALQVFLDTYAPDGLRPDLAREALALCSPEAFALRLADPACHCVLAERAGHLLGFAECNLALRAPAPHLGAGVELVRLYVQRHAHRMGLGAALLRRAEEAARNAGSPLLWLTAWVGNTNACAFYAAQGYEGVGTTEYVFENQSYENRIYCRRLDSQ